MKYFITFGQNHPARDGFVTVEAPSYNEAHDWAMKEYKGQFAFCYPENKFEPEYFPLGELQRVSLGE